MVSVSLLSGAGFAGAAGSAGSVSALGTGSAVFSAGAFAVLPACFKEAEKALHFFASFPDFRNRNIPAVTAPQRMRASAISFWERSFWKKTARRSRETIRILMLLENTFFLIWFFHSFPCKIKKEESQPEILSLRCNSSCTASRAKGIS
ncbi:hypothetical protein [Faecalibaculum rodentium]|uniref:hypothetical protein n=1 Tax=Faecalibaculum rodentium TaxID=1702221 RepID=UPI0025A93B27|nr:hypothetical protein [Faecalibaculum rodentium]